MLKDIPMIRIGKFIAFSLSLFFLACTTPLETKNNYEDYSIFANTIEVTVKQITQNSVIVDYRGGLPNPCYEYVRSESKLDGQIITTSVLMRSTSDLCIAILGFIHIPDLEISVPGPGYWTLRFPRYGDQEPYELELVVPYP